MKKKLPLHIQIILGLVAGILWAIVGGYLGWSDFTIDWIDPFGTIFINVLKMIAVPLVLFSIITGITSLTDISSLGRMGIKTLGMYMLTTFFAVSTGILWVNLARPGDNLPEEQGIVNRISYEIWAHENDVEILDDDNYLGKPEYAKYVEAARGKVQEYADDEAASEKIAMANDTKEDGPLQFIVDMVPNNIFSSFNDSSMLQVIFFAIFFGLSIVMLPTEKTTTVVSFFEGGTEIFIKMVDIVMKAAPYFVFALMAGSLAKLAGDNPTRMFSIFFALGWYMGVVIFGLALLVFGVYPVWVASIISKKHGVSFGKAYMFFLKGIRPAQLLGFSTSSSAATLPVTMECVHENLHVDEEVSSFVLPIGATVNMDGTSLYQAVAVIFLAQFHLVDLTITQQFIIVLTATLASIGSAAVPSAGLIMLIIVLESVGLNPAWIAIIFPVDRILDMCRTVVNITGDATVSTVVAQSEGKLGSVD